MRVMMVGMLVLAGCAAVGPATHPSTAFSEAVKGRVAGETRMCVTGSTRGSLTVVDSRTLAYDGGSVLWINRLRDDCPGVRPLSTLIIETTGIQYCRGDRFRAIETGSSIPGPTCVLGDFTAFRKIR